MKKLIFIFLVFSTLNSFGQFNYLVQFKDKANSPFTISNPEKFLSQRAIERRNKQNIVLTEHDLPPNPEYLKAISQTGAKIRYTTRWMNGAIINCDTITLKKVLALENVKGIFENRDLMGKLNKEFPKNRLSKKDKFESENESLLSFNAPQLEMLGADHLYNEGYDGKGLIIGVLDAGFLNANKISYFKPLFDEGRILETWDFVEDEKNVFEDHGHGTNVLSCMGSTPTDEYRGTAPMASYVLYRTEDVNSETRIEEAFWLIAIERLDSLGVDVVNSSLAYFDFDNPVQNYKQSDINGNTALITKAADWAAKAGILVVNSAANEGNGAWQYIAFPADADSIISVAAVNSSEERVGFSSIGYPSDPRVKPELAAQGGATILINTQGNLASASGTSFSSPILAGFAASVWQAYPNLSAYQLRDLLIKSGSQYTSPDKLLGYGIPNYLRIKEIILEETFKDKGEGLYVFPNPINTRQDLNVYLKTNPKEKNLLIEIYDRMGLKLYSSRSISNLAKINLDFPISTGLYFLKVTLDKNSWSKQLIIND